MEVLSKSELYEMSKDTKNLFSYNPEAILSEDVPDNAYVISQEIGKVEAFRINPCNPPGKKYRALWSESGMFNEQLGNECKFGAEFGTYSFCTIKEFREEFK